MTHLNIQVSGIIIPFYIISFIGFIENINLESKVKITYFENHNININILKIIILSIISIILLFELPAITSAFVLTLVYLVISTIKLIQSNKKKQIAILWGIPLLLVALISFSIGNSDIGRFRVSRIISSFVPESDPNGSGWIGMNQKLIINSANLYGKADNMSESIQLFNEGTNYAFIAVLANYGWIISIAMIVTITAFNIKLIFDAIKVKDRYGKLLIIGFACLFIFRSIFCILMNLNLGIQASFDIPFISYGKVNLIMDIISLALVFSIYRRKDIIFNLSKRSTIVKVD